MQTTSAMEAPNPIHRYGMDLVVNGHRYRVDYVAAERIHRLGILGGRVVVLYVWDHNGDLMALYDHAWQRQPHTPEGRMVIRKILEKAR